LSTFGGPSDRDAWVCITGFEGWSLVEVARIGARVAVLGVSVAVLVSRVGVLLLGWL
jgi:hypothetical protein